MEAFKTCTYSASDVGCHIGNIHCPALSYADDLTLMASSTSAMDRLLKICEAFSREFSLKFNSTKSQCLVFNRVADLPTFMLGDEEIPRVEKTIHLGTWIGKKSHENNITKAASDLYIRTNKINTHFPLCSYSVKRQLFKSFCSSFYGSPLWNLSRLGLLSVAWRKSLRRLFGLPNRTHCAFLPLVYGGHSLENDLFLRYCKFMDRVMSSDNKLTRVASELIRGSSSTAALNLRFVLSKIGRSSDMINNDSSLFCLARTWLSHALSGDTDEIAELIVEILKIRSGELHCNFPMSILNDILNQISID